VGARIGASASPGEVLVSSTVRDLVAGSGIGFEDAGIRQLKGVTDDWRVFRVADASQPAIEPPGPSIPIPELGN
jgi:class 3 adenylate cyclase